MSETATKTKGRGDTVCVYVGEARRAALAERARRLGYSSFSEFVCVLLDCGPDVPAADLPRLKAMATLDGVTLAESVRARF